MGDPIQNAKNGDASSWGSSILSEPLEFFKDIGEGLKTTGGFIKEGDYSSLLNLFQGSASSNPKKKWEEHFDSALDLADQAKDFSEVEEALKKMEEAGKDELSPSQIEGYKKAVMGRLYQAHLKAEKRRLTYGKTFDLSKDIDLSSGLLTIQGKDRTDIVSYGLGSGKSYRDVAEDLEKFKGEVKEARIKKIGLDLLHGAEALIEIPGKVYSDLEDVAGKASREVRSGTRQLEQGVKDLVGLVF